MRKENGQFGKGDHWRDHQVFRERAWLVENYVTALRSTGDIAAQFGVTDAAILFWLRKHGIERRTVSGARRVKHWGLSGPDNPMWGQRGELNPRWLGGVTAERQAFYTSVEWKAACAAVWRRDQACCRKCGKRKAEDGATSFHVHHVVSFAVKRLRADPDNLLLLCEACHRFVHSRRNVDREFLPQRRDSAASG